jgi:hypothetical protein
MTYFGAIVIRDYDGEESTYANEVYVTEYCTHSSLSDSRGNPLAYEDRTPLGFNLSYRETN